MIMISQSLLKDISYDSKKGFFLLTLSLNCINDKILNPRMGIISGERGSRYQLNVIRVWVYLEDASQGNRDVTLATLIGLPFPLLSHLIRSKSSPM